MTTDHLAALLLELLSVSSVTGQERALADLLTNRYAAEEVRRIGDSLVVGALGDDRPLVLLIAHLDTVPPAPGQADPHLDGDRVVGRGASDMKAGLAVAMHVFEDAALRDGPYALALVAYAREEGAHQDNELAAVLGDVPELTEAALAVVLEPTDLEVQLGCMGTLHAEVAFAGRAAHSARPWQGRNALTAAGPFLTELHERPSTDVEVDGLLFREVLVPTGAATANARNVVPDRFTVTVNYRYAPDKTRDRAERVVADLVGDRAEVTVVDHALAGRPTRDAPAVAAFITAAAATVSGANGSRAAPIVAPKQAWTDVARFSEVGVPALNYGPGLTAQAHQAGEHVPSENLTVARTVLARFLSATPSGAPGTLPQ